MLHHVNRYVETADGKIILLGTERSTHSVRLAETLCDYFNRAAGNSINTDGTFQRTKGQTFYMIGDVLI